MDWFASCGLSMSSINNQSSYHACDIFEFFIHVPLLPPLCLSNLVYLCMYMQALCHHGGENTEIFGVLICLLSVVLSVCCLQCCCSCVTWGISLCSSVSWYKLTCIELLDFLSYKNYAKFNVGTMRNIDMKVLQSETLF